MAISLFLNTYPATDINSGSAADNAILLQINKRREGSEKNVLRMQFLKTSTVKALLSPGGGAYLLFVV